MERYGHIDRDGYPLAAWIWGHRLRIGQHWMEYLLEFLNVLAGFEYELGQGVDGAPKQEYTRFTRLGLRRFVFYDDREKTRHPFDEAARAQLLAALQQQVVTGDGDEQSGLDLARSLLRAFSAVEAQRSWYAKSLFPAHHNFLFWEALRKGATKYKGRRVPAGTPHRMLDADIAFDARNFFARGGELYYLMLSAGTEGNPDRRQRIAGRLRELLNDHNQALGLLAEIVDRTWQRQVGDGSAPDGGAQDKKGRLGWIPDPDCPLYVTVAEDVDTFLQADLDPLETLDLLAHLVGFHLTLYIYHRAHPEATPERLADGDCQDICRPALLVDALEGADGGVIRRVSAALFREQEAHILQRARTYVQQQVTAWAAGVPDEVLARCLDSEAQAHFHLRSLSKRARNAQPEQASAECLRAQGQRPGGTIHRQCAGSGCLRRRLRRDPDQPADAGLSQELFGGASEVGQGRGPGCAAQGAGRPLRVGGQSAEGVDAGQRAFWHRNDLRCVSGPAVQTLRLGRWPRRGTGVRPFRPPAHQRRVLRPQQSGSSGENETRRAGGGVFGCDGSGRG